MQATSTDERPERRDDRTGPALSVEQFGAQCRITIKRIEKHNALSRDVLAELARTVRHAADDPCVHYVVIRGDGSRYFAAGGDLVDLATIRTEEATVAFAAASRSALDAIRGSAIPVIAWLNGDALGGGAELALACDLRVMAPGARIGYVQSRLAITSAWGGAADLCAVVRPSRALRMMARAEMIDAAQALAEGLTDAVLDGDIGGADATNFFAPLEAAPRHLLIAIKANVAACRPQATYQAAREIEQANLVATWTHPAHWAAVDRVFTRSRRDPR